MKLFTLFLFCLVCTAQSTPVSKSDSTDVAMVLRFDMDLIAGMKALLIELYNNLSDAAAQASESFETFSKGLETQWLEFVERVESRLENFRDAVEDYIESFYEKVSDVSDTVQACIDENKEKAEDLYKQTLDSVKQCGSTRVEAISEMLNNLMVLSDNSSVVMQELHTDVDMCYNRTGKDVIPLAQCLAGVVVDAELRATGYLAQTGYQIWSINLSLFALPAALEVCAGQGLIDAGVDTGAVFRDIAACVASSAYEYFASNTTVDYKKINSTLLKVPKP